MSWHNFEKAGATLARVLVPFLGIGLVIHEMVFLPEPRWAALPFYALLLAGPEALAASLHRRVQQRERDDDGITATGSSYHRRVLRGDDPDDRDHQHRMDVAESDLRWAG